MSTHQKKSPLKETGPGLSTGLFKRKKEKGRSEWPWGVFGVGPLSGCSH